MKSPKEYSPIGRCRIYRKAANYLFNANETNGICLAFSAAAGVDIYTDYALEQFPELNIVNKDSICGTTELVPYWFDGECASWGQDLRDHRGWALLFAAEIANDEAAPDKKNAKKNKEGKK